MAATGVFIHGLEGSGQGTKATFFRKRFPGMIISDYRGPLENRMKTLETLVATVSSIILVGSSYGGLMGAIYGARRPTHVEKLILLAPALSFRAFKPWTTGQITVPTTIFHGVHDDVVPMEPVREIAEKVFPHLTFHIVDDDHMLRKTFHHLNWDKLLGK